MELRKDVPPVRPQRESFHHLHRVQVKLAVEVREQRSAARRLPPQPVPETACLDGDEEQIALAKEVLLCRFNHLGGGGKMDEAVAAIDRAAMERAEAFSLAP